MQANYRPALEIAQRALRAASPHTVAERSGAVLRRGEEGEYLLLKLLNRDYRVPLPESIVYDVGTGHPAGASTTLVILHYLATVNGSPIKGEWIPFRSLPGGNIYEQAFRQQCFVPLIATFGSSPERFEQAAASLGGVKSTMGDRSFVFQALPRLPIACVLWLADEEQGAEVNLLYDAVAPHCLPTEDLAALGRMLTFGLIKCA